MKFQHECVCSYKVSFYLLIFVLLSLGTAHAQFDRGLVDFGLGGVISVGVQEETGFDVRLQYTSVNKRNVYIAEYNRFYSRLARVEDRRSDIPESFNEFGFSYTTRIVCLKPVTFFGGIGYVANDYEVLSNARDTSNLFIQGDSYNHGLQIKLRGVYTFLEKLNIFSEINFKSFGRRYDTVVLGISYSLQI